MTFRASSEEELRARRDKEVNTVFLSITIFSWSKILLSTQRKKKKGKTIKKEQGMPTFWGNHKHWWCTGKLSGVHIHLQNHFNRAIKAGISHRNSRTPRKGKSIPRYFPILQPEDQYSSTEIPSCEGSCTTSPCFSPQPWPHVGLTAAQHTSASFPMPPFDGNPFVLRVDELRL